MRLRVLLPTCSSLLLLLCSVSLFGQSGNEASIAGLVTDSTGAVVAGADVELSRHTTGLRWRTTSTDRGLFQFTLTPAGIYELTVRRAGFQTTVVSELVVTTGDRATLKIQLKVAGVNEAVNVRGDLGILGSTKSGVSSTVQAHAIETLPTNGRNFSDFVLLTAGVTRDARFPGDFSFGGQRQMNTVMLDGLDDTDTFFGPSFGHARAPYQFSQDTVQEFQVNSNSYSAEFGRAGGGVVNAITKSGTNEIHGTAFWYFRDRAFNANDAVNKLNGLPRSPYHFNNLGATIGGPLRRGKLFYFGAYEGQRSQRSNEVILYLPANFALSSDQTVAGYQTTALGYLQQRLGSWMIPADEDVILLKVDGYFGKQMLSTRWNRQRFTTATASGAQISREHSTRVYESSDSIALTLTSTSSASKVNVVRFGYTSGGQDIPRSGVLPEASIFEGGQLALTIGNVVQGQTALRRYEGGEKYSVSFGKHAVKFGTDVLWDRTRFTNGVNFHGLYQFQSLEDFGRSLSGKPQPLGSDFYQQSFSTSPGDMIDVEPISVESSAYAEDEWRAMRRLTLTLGLRYDVQWMAAPSVRNPSPALAAVNLDTSAFNTDLNNVAPRIGFAWNPLNRVVVRGGYGIYYARTLSIMNARADFQNGITLQSRIFRAGQPTAVLIPAYPNTFCGAPGESSSCGPPTAGASAPAITLFSPNYRQPYVQQGDFGLEIQPKKNTTLSMSYVFAHGVHLQRTRDLNLGIPTTPSYIGIAQTQTELKYEKFTASKPIAGFDRVWAFESSASSVYHGFIAEVNQRYRNSLEFSASYTLSKVIDDNPDAAATNIGNSDFKLPMDSTRPQLERAVGIDDQPHRFVAYGTWDMPSSRSRGILYWLTNSWQISGIFSAQSGFPYSALVRFDLNNDGNSATDRSPGLGRNTFRLPASIDLDTRLTRNVPVSDRVQLQLIAELFNAMNRANITSVRNVKYNRSTSASQCGVATAPCLVPQTTQTVGLGAFGVPTATAGPRIAQFSARVRF